MLNNKSNPPEVLAIWNYQPDLWRDFLKYESGIYKGSVRKAKHLFFGVLILTLAVVFLGSLIPFLVTDDWNIEMLSPALGFGAVGWIFIVLTGILWLYRRSRFNRLQARTGEVVISLKGIKANEVDFNWDFLAFGIRFDKIKRKTVSIGVEKTFEILEFHTVNYANVRHHKWEYFGMRVPIPFGKETEAERVISRLRTHLAMTNQEWINANVALGHSFSEDVCRNCRNSVTQVICSNYKCPNSK